MVDVRKVDDSMVEEIQEQLLEFKFISKDAWKRILTYQWGQDEDYRGLALMDGQEAVGFLGMIFSKREIAGKTEKFCNLNAWVVRQSHRSYSLSLLYPLSRMNDYTITNLSSFKHGVEIMKRFGFRELDTTSRIIPCLPIRTGSRSFGWMVTVDTIIIGERLNPRHRRIFEDHRPYQCVQMLLYNEAYYCYTVFEKRKTRGLKYYYAHYISNPDLFVDHMGLMRSYLFWRHHAAFMLIDSRYLCSKTVPLSINHQLLVPRLFKSSADLPSFRIDSLYSELILMPTKTGLLSTR